MHRLSLQSSRIIRSQLTTMQSRLYRFRKPRTNSGRAMSSSATTAVNAKVQDGVSAGSSVHNSARSNGSSTHVSDRKFQDLDISPELKANIKHQFMTEVQAVTLEPALRGRNLLVQAKTGTGKTLGFLLPAVESLLKNPVTDRGNGVPILVISPTRELALQIEDEVRALRPHLRIRSIIGGTKRSAADYDRFANHPYDIVIATPGRLYDHFTGPKAEQVQAKFTGLRTLVLDEVDRLLDGGFARELDGVINLLPSKTRQNLFFSATISDKVKLTAKKYIPSGEYDFITTLKEDDVNTHQHVHQSYIVTPFREHLPTLLALLHLDSIKYALPNNTTSTPSLSPSTSPAPKSSSKVIVFFPTARHVSFAMEAFSTSAIRDYLPPVYSLHSRLSQTARNRATEAFRESRNAILLSSDVAARGVDFPGVTLVVQVGIPVDSEQYIHRLGRTARAGAEGQGILILDPSEERFVTSSAIRKLDLVPYIPTPSSPGAKELLTYTHTFQQHLTTASEAIMENKPELIEGAYRAWLGYYNTKAQMFRWSKEELVEQALKYAKEAMGWKMEHPPSLEARAAGRMGLRQVKGVNVESTRDTIQRKTQRKSHKSD